VRRLAALAGALALAGLLIFLLGRGTSGPATAAAQGANQPPTAGDAFEPVLGLPATNVHILGSSPRQEAGEAWAYGALGETPAIVKGAAYSNQLVLLEHTDLSGWQVVPLPSAPAGGPLAASVQGYEFPGVLGSLGGRVTAAGGVVLLTPGGIVVRDPSGLPRLISEPTATQGAAKTSPELLGKGEALPPSDPGADTAYAAIDETSGHTGLLIAPYGDGAGAEGSGSGIVGPGVLHYDGEKWTREAIEWKGAKPKQEALTPQALACGATQASEGAGSPEGCWLLASYHAEASGSEPNHLALFRRVVSKSDPSTYTWEPEPVADWLLGEEHPPASVTGSTSVQGLGSGAQTLTVTAQGVWVDFQAVLGGSSTATDFSELVTPPSKESAPPSKEGVPPSKEDEDASVVGTWCYPIVTGVCERSLGAALPARYRSFASPGASPTDPGARVLTGLRYGAMLELASGAFQYMIGAGGGGGEEYGAVFNLSPQGTVEQGWIGEGEEPGSDDQGESQLVEVAPRPEQDVQRAVPQLEQGDQLRQEPVPFRHPLLALAQAPGSIPGAVGGAAIAVGMEGEIGRYIPGEGWRSEALYNSSGEAQAPTLRGVAWPEPGRAYAVGDHGAMWVWRADTGLWEPDPATPYNFIGNLTAIAFSEGEPELGYAVGKQGVLLKYGKTWEPISSVEGENLEHELKIPEQDLNFTSVTFAGGEALATYRAVVEDPRTAAGPVESGGLLAYGEDPVCAALHQPSCWHVDQSAAALLAQLPYLRDTVLSKVAGLSDGGAVAAGPGLVIERETSSAPWRFSPQPLPEAQNIPALAAYREASGPIRAVVSIDLDPHTNPNVEDLKTNAYAGDLPPSTGAGQPPAYLPPDPLPDTGYVLKETAAGWSDVEHMALEATGTDDAPARPDPALALLVDPSGGGSGLAVGGQTDDSKGSPPSPNFFETATAMRFGGSEAAAGGDATAPVATGAGDATFAVGGQAACREACADFANEGLAPDVLLSHALAGANQIAASSTGGLRAFLYAGSSQGEDVLSQVLGHYAGSLSVYAPSAFGSNGAPTSATPYYSFVSSGASGGSVMVIVLAFSNGTLEVPGAPPGTQEAWLRTELEAAKDGPMPAIVMGNASLGFTLPERIGQDPEPVQAGDAASVLRILVEGGASAYLFDYPGVNVTAQIRYGNAHIPAFGTGTLGYSSPPSGQTDSLGSSGFLLVQVDTAARNQSSNVAPVSARVEPNIGELAVQASDGVLLRRSQIGLFEGLARIPASGRVVSGTATGAVDVEGPVPYEPIPFECLGPDCGDAVPTEYTFSSSNPDVGNFVAHEASSLNPRQVQLGANKQPIPDPHSGLFCAYNEGTTTISITAGGLTYSEPVTVQGGSVEYPCGTVPLKNPPALESPAQAAFPVPELSATNPPPISPQIQAIAPPPAVPVHPKPHHHRRSPAPPPLFLPVVAGIALLPPAILPPPPITARPSPPTGTSSAQVTQSAVAPERQREDQEAIDMVHNMAAYSEEDKRSVPSYLPAVVLLLAFSCAGLYDAKRRRRPELAISDESGSGQRRIELR
jgi:hypothetical protein